jgi:hypothetical protein
MAKIRLNPEEIRVNGFEVLPEDAGRGGTVQGAEMPITNYTQCQQDTCWNGSCGTGVPCRQCP